MRRLTSRGRLKRLVAGFAAILLAFTSSLPAHPASAAGPTLRYVGGEPATFDPAFIGSAGDVEFLLQLYAGLTRLDEDGQPYASLAESWSVSDDGRTYTFHMRPGLTFSDGTPLTPDDIIYSYQRIPTVLNSPSSFSQAVKPIERIEVVDPLTLRMHTKEPQPLLPYFLASARIVSKKAAQGATTADFNSGKAAIGAGPYKMESVLLGDRVIFVRNENYWGPKPYWDKVVYRLIANDAARTAAIQAGDVDIIDQVSTRDVGTLQKNPKLEIRSPSGQRLIYIYMDTEREPTPYAFDLNGQKLDKNPLKDVRVRKALSLAINREGIKTQIMDGFAVPTGQIMPEGAIGYTPDIKPDRYDPAQAKKLLAEAGYPNGFAPRCGRGSA
jgi:peptide/nickel transport system substrate-binding protein